MKEYIKQFVPKSALRGYYYVLEYLAAARFGFPGRKVQVIGVTGTKGKSSTVYIATRILEEAGIPVASISSIGFRLNRESVPNSLKMTLPSRANLQKFFKRAKQRGTKYFLLEATSQGLDQHRLDFANLTMGVFTNLAPEHIEYHGSYKEYRRAKARLFALLKPGSTMILNAQDKESMFFASLALVKERNLGVIYFDTKKDGILKTHLLGEFNKQNVLAAATIARQLGISEKIITKALDAITMIPGRLEAIENNRGIQVFVDYAHNPSSLKAALLALRKLKASSQKLLVLTGAQGGGRDKWKRPEMGKIAATYADTIIITNEDPYKENPEQIIEDVYQGALKAKDLKEKTILKIPERGEAIEKILSFTKKGDIVLIAGKGSEIVMETKQGKIAWSDREMVEEYFKKGI